MTKTKSKPDKAAMTVGDVAEELGLCRNTVYRMVQAGTLPRLPGMRKVLVPRAAFEAYVGRAAA